MTVKSLSQKISKAKQKGMSIIEFTIYLALAALAFMGIFGLYVSASNEQNTGDLVKSISSIQNGVRTLSGGQSSYGTGDLSAALIKSGKVPSTMRIAGSAINHGFNGTVAIAGATAAFTITITNLPQEACIPVLTGAQGFPSVKVGARPAVTGPVAPATAATECAATANTVVLTSY